MTSDPWIESIKAIEPKINELIQAMTDGPVIKPILSQRGKKWNITLEEVWPPSVDRNYTGTNDLDKKVEWATIELQKWDVTRTAWNIWQFNSRKDAEKFITFYNLIWA